MASDGSTNADSDLRVTRGCSSSPDAANAIAEVWEQIKQTNPVGVVVFCSSKYDLTAMADAIKQTFPCPVFGCTTAGEINEHGFADQSVSAVCFGGDVTTDIFEIDLVDYVNGVAKISDKVNRTLIEAYDRHAFGFLLVDGLSLAEEHLTANLYQGIGHIPLIGGSAGDGFHLHETHVLVNGRFISGHAVFACFTTMNRIMAIKFDHFRPSADLMLVTKSDPSRRIIHELNGELAAKVYARTLGLPMGEVSGQDFSAHPLVVEVGGHPYIRSPQCFNPDGSISLFCAVETGLVLSIAQGVDPVETARNAFDRVKQYLGSVGVILGCDCVQRKLEYIHRDILDEMGKVMSEFNVVGFSTYGEQFNAVHINQTFTGIAIAA